jgi:hypothetical protein
MSKIQIGDKVKVNFEAVKYYHGRTGIVKAIMREYFIDGDKKRWRLEYPIQFKRPTEWAFFTRKELIKLNDE